MSWVRRAGARWVSEPLAWIDAHAQLPAGRLSQNARVAVVLLTSALILTVMAYAILSAGHQRAAAQAAIDALRGIDAELGEGLDPYLPLMRVIMWSMGAMMMYFVIPALIIRRIFGHRLRDYGLTLAGFRRHLWIYALLFVPVGALVLMVAGSPEFQAKYPFYRNPIGVWDLVVWELAYASQFFALEFFFRGFMLHGIKDAFGRNAVLVMVIPYAMIHLSKPFYESLGAIVAGCVLGVLSLRTGSIFGGVAIHVGVAVSMDLAALALRGS